MMSGTLIRNVITRTLKEEAETDHSVRVYGLTLTLPVGLAKHPIHGRNEGGLKTSMWVTIHTGENTSHYDNEISMSVNH